MKKRLLSFIFILGIFCINKYTNSPVYAETLDDVIMNNSVFEDTTECLECKLISPIFLAVSQFSYIVYHSFQTILVILLILSVSYWLLMFMWNKIKIDGDRIQGLEFFKDIFKQMLKITSALVILTSSPQFFLKYTVEPMLDVSNFVTNKFMDISKQINDSTEKVKFSDTKYNTTGDIKAKQAFSDEMRKSLINILENYSSTYRYGMIFGVNMLKVTIQEGLTYEAIILLAKIAIKKVIEVVLAFFGIPAAATEQVLNFIDKIATASRKVIGIIYLLIAIIGAMIFVLYFLISLKILTILAGFILNMGFAVILLPFAVLSWAVKDMNIKVINNLNLIGFVKTLFIGWISHLAMLSVILTFGSYILESLLTIETTVSGYTITLKEYIMLNSNILTNPLTGPKIIDVIWQNMDITLIFICFGWIMSYLIKNVPVYTAYFFEPVTNLEFSDKLWHIIRGIFKKTTDVTAKTITTTYGTIKGLSHIIQSMAGNENNVIKTEDNLFMKKIKQTIYNTSTLLTMYFKMPKDISKITRYSNNIHAENIKEQKNKFQKINQPILKTDTILNKEDKNIINMYYHDRKRNNVKETYNKLSDTGKNIFINLTLNTLSDDDIDIIVKIVLTNKAEKDFYKRNDITIDTPIRNKNQQKELNEFIKSEVKKGIFLYRDTIKNINISKNNLVTKEQFIDLVQQMNFDKNYLYHMDKDIDKWNKENPFPENNSTTKNIHNLIKLFKTSNKNTQENEKLIDAEFEIRNIPKLTILNEQKVVIENILDVLGPIQNIEDPKDLHYAKKLQKFIKNINEELNTLNEEYDLEYDPLEERINFYKTIMKNPLARKVIQENHLEQYIKKLINDLNNTDDSISFDWDADIDLDEDNNDDDD